MSVSDMTYHQEGVFGGGNWPEVRIDAVILGAFP